MPNFIAAAVVQTGLVPFGRSTALLKLANLCGGAAGMKLGNIEFPRSSVEGFTEGEFDFVRRTTKFTGVAGHAIACAKHHQRVVGRYASPDKTGFSSDTNTKPCIAFPRRSPLFCAIEQIEELMLQEGL